MGKQEFLTQNSELEENIKIWITSLTTVKNGFITFRKRGVKFLALKNQGIIHLDVGRMLLKFSKQIDNYIKTFPTVRVTEY